LRRKRKRKRRRRVRMRCYFDLGFFISRPRVRTTRQRQRQGQGLLRILEVRLKRRWIARTKSYIDSGLIGFSTVFFVQYMYYLEGYFPQCGLGLHDTNTAAETTSTATNTIHYFYISGSVYKTLQHLLHNTQQLDGILIQRPFSLNRLRKRPFKYSALEWIKDYSSTQVYYPSSTPVQLVDAQGPAQELMTKKLLAVRD
jgi:hypothetical protein